MKRIITLIAVGIAYMIIIVVFSFSNNDVNSDQTSATAQNIYADNSLSADPMPPPPPKKGGD
ncbi:hypothetical protein JW824_08810 [bacterium]|nr:hypothetical protein [bacterium]